MSDQQGTTMQPVPKARSANSEKLQATGCLGRLARPGLHEANLTRLAFPDTIRVYAAANGSLLTTNQQSKPCEAPKKQHGRESSWRAVQLKDVGNPGTPRTPPPNPCKNAHQTNMFLTSGGESLRSETIPFRSNSEAEPLEIHHLNHSRG